MPRRFNYNFSGWLKKYFIPLFIFLLSLTTVFSFYLLSSPSDQKTVFSIVDRSLYHSFLLPTTTQELSSNAPITIVAIDDEDLERYGSWPWSRALLANGIEAINRYDPALVGFSILIDPLRTVAPSENAALFKELAATKHLVTAFNFNFSQRFQIGTEEVSWIAKAALDDRPTTEVSVFPYQRPFSFHAAAPEVVNASANMGFLSYANSKGLLVYPTLSYFGSHFYKSYPLAIAQSFKQQQTPTKLSILRNREGVEGLEFGNHTLPTLNNGTILLRPYKKLSQRNDRAFPQLRFRDLLEGKIQPHKLRDKIVLVDLTASGYSQSFNVLDGGLASRPVIHATAVANLLQNDFIRRDGRATLLETLLILLVTLLVWWCSRNLKAVTAVFAICLTIPATLLLIALAAIHFANLWLLISYPLAALLISFPLQFGYKHFVEDRQRRIVERALTGYTSKTVMDRLIERGESFLTLGGERRDLTILLFDIKGFTQLSHRLTPEETFKLLNHIFKLTDEIIIDRFNGMIDKKMGDACIALFGLDGGKEHALHAVQAALAIQETLFERFAELSRLAHKQELGPGCIQIRVGITTGTVLLGNVGSERHKNFTAVGEIVNQCQRLEAACSLGEVLISEETYRRLGDQVRVEKKQAPGKREEESYLAYRVLGLAH